MRWFAAILAVTLSSAACAQDGAPHLQISTESGQTTFHLGERIRLKMSFTGPDDKSLILSMRDYERSGRLNLDDFEVSPSTGWGDPLAQYLAYHAAIWGGPNSKTSLGSEPVIRFENLNEWVRFDQPGVYTVTVTSHRVALAGKDVYFTPDGGQTVRSNGLQLRIIAASPAWQKAKLAEIQRLLAVPHSLQSEPPPGFLAAINDLRYLASPGAIAELAANLRDDRPELMGDAFFGIVGLRPSSREIALTVMNHLIEDPAFPVYWRFLAALPQLQIEDVPLPSTEETDNKVREQLLAYNKKQQPLMDDAWLTVASALERKTEPARGITAQTLAEAMPKHPSPTAIGLVGSVLRASFPRLSTAEKAMVLTDQWDLVRSPELLPQLRLLAKSRRKDSKPIVIFGDDTDKLRAAALRRWYEFEPDAARDEVLRQIGSARPALSAEDVGFLPAEPLPQFEEIWAEAFSKADSMESDLLGHLLIRFGTGDLAGQMALLATQPTPDNACNRQLSALAYVVRFAPQSAKPILESAADSSKEVTLCCGAPLYSISELVQDPVLTDAAVKALNNSHPNVVQDALRYLTEHGDEASRQPILDSYLKWSERRADQPEVSDEEEHREQQSDLQLGSQFARALLANQAWLADAALKTTVLQHCVEKSVCETVQNLLVEDRAISVSLGMRGTEFYLGELQISSLKLLEAKLDQYPKGTEFTVLAVMSGSPREQRTVEASLPELLAKHGMKVRESAE